MDIKKKVGSVKDVFLGRGATPKYKKVIIALIAGVLMIIAGNFLMGTTKSGGINNILSKTSKPKIANENLSIADKLIGPDEYAELLQKQIEDLLSSIDGVGKVKVLVYVEESCEVVPAYNSDRSDSSIDETDAQGGKRKQEEKKDREDLASSNGTIVLKVLYPKIKGICVSAQGVKSNVIKEKIKNSLMALYGIEAHRIEIVSMKG